MTEHGFWGTTLTDETREVTWNVNLNRYLLMRVQCLTVSQIFLGEGAIKGEEHIIQVESGGRAGKMSMPIARLQRGTIENFPLKVMFSDSPVRFQLIKGSGPVHVIATHTFDLDKELNSEFVEEESETQDEAEAETEPDSYSDGGSPSSEADSVPEKKKRRVSDVKTKGDEPEKRKKMKKPKGKKKDKTPSQGKSKN
ncbi:hypothetical protein B7P43_G05005 [Cryptotermes secundus]|uniref:Nucleoplasmin core domain-containing protein n=1 Tax=Cryptotermes secundus TaxID=105785 RepID=A0A2J7PQM3_9NEOP|nr:nucleoplasmin-like protein isoform X3 [Cryptotermes secundus]PNF18635.1 hypothetical protein B7P43_G05005 [Cryptotermes secundus]